MIDVFSRYIFLLGGLLLGTVLAPRANGQQHHDLGVVDEEAAQVFVENVRTALQEFENRNHAIAAGYRQIGPDFPGMGEHWVHPRLIFSDSIQASSPPVLSYVDLGGRPVLTGAAFALPLAGDDAPPELPFGDVWHVHEGTVDEETLVLNPGVRMRGTESLTRLAMFHVWTGLENPDGVFHQDNWTLPFIRLGLTVPDGASSEAGKAVFLLEGGVEYYLRLIELAASPGQPELKHVERILESAARDVQSLVTEKHPDPPDVEQLEAIWSDVRADLQAGTSPGTWSKLADLFSAR